MKHSTQPLATRSERTLGPARVVRSMNAEVAVELDGDTRSARLALAYPYRPVRGDEVLVIGDSEQLFVIGVLEGRGAPRLRGQNVTVKTTRGKLRLSAGRAMELTTHRLDLLADANVTRESEQAVTKFGSFAQQVTRKLATLSGDFDQVIAQRWSHQARAITAKVKKTFYINGGRIRMS